MLAIVASAIGHKDDWRISRLLATQVANRTEIRRVDPEVVVPSNVALALPHTSTPARACSAR